MRNRDIAGTDRVTSVGRNGFGGALFRVDLGTRRCRSARSGGASATWRARCRARSGTVSGSSSHANPSIDAGPTPDWRRVPDESRRDLPSCDGSRQKENTMAETNERDSYHRRGGVAVPVRDQDRALRFYVNKLGLRFGETCRWPRAVVGSGGTAAATTTSRSSPPAPRSVGLDTGIHLHDLRRRSRSRRPPRSRR